MPSFFNKTDPSDLHDPANPASLCKRRGRSRGRSRLDKNEQTCARLYQHIQPHALSCNKLNVLRPPPRGSSYPRAGCAWHFARNPENSAIAPVPNDEMCGWHLAKNPSKTWAQPRLCGRADAAATVSDSTAELARQPGAGRGLHGIARRTCRHLPAASSRPRSLHRRRRSTPARCAGAGAGRSRPGSGRGSRTGSARTGG